MRHFPAAGTRRILSVGGILALGIFAGRAPGLAQPAPAGDAYPVAVPSASGLELSFAPRVADGMLLTVAGPDLHATREFSPGAPPTFVLIGDRGPLPDGRYKYELRTQPQVDLRLREIATQNDDEDLIRALAREEDELTRVQVGVFEVWGGSIVLPRRDRASEPAAGAHAHGDHDHHHDH